MSNKEIKSFDAIVIGSGQAGTPLVFKLASHGQKVAFIEKEHFGGTCLNVGCTPTKTYVASARRMWEAKHGEELGIEIPAGAKANLRKIKARKDALIKKSVDGIAQGVEKNDNIDFFKGEARFEGRNIVAVNNELLTADEIYINVGGSAFIPDGYQDIPYLTNESILDLEELPEHLLVIGGSYIGLEFGQMFSRLGSKVTIIEQGGSIIAREDEETSKTIQHMLEEEGVDFRLGAECVAAKNNGLDGIVAQIRCSREGAVDIKGSHLLLAVGRRPNTTKLQLEKTGVRTDDKGYIEVNDRLETNVKGIFALGDCNGKGAFTHTAYNDYEIIAENKFEGKDRKVSDRITTYGLYVDPPLGRVGITEKEARQKGLDVLIGHRPFSRIARAKEKGETKGYMSVVVSAKSKKILGATVLGVGGDEIISGIVNIMYADSSYEVIRDSVQAHPTVSELIPTVLETLKKL
ncbi:FAD-containing oxidoreductase [Flagellimonas sp.]|jgi:pyruvate/2-oxoglutarate dehydrogenase complex dihydrolipoamide dehydrogenase (E3) component|uniref:FAD-containing oxidoreductase n=1 Tax=Flagellimonas sp. TaxID=2058762 RepID=UPI003BAC13AB